MRNFFLYLLVFLLFACENNKGSAVLTEREVSAKEKFATTSLIVLGTIQDAGSPHIACKKQCCKNPFENPDPKRQVVSLGLFDHINNKRYLFEATPDMPKQLKALKNYGSPSDREIANGIFLTHAHIGHYTGLMYLGKEATNAKNIPVYAMPIMKTYLETNGPWSQLVSSGNIDLIELNNETTVQLSKDIAVIPFLVPHRDEFSETVGYKIIGPNKSALFIPDIDKWDKWNKSISDEIKKVDYAFLDATFYSGEEINNRDISLIPHPFIVESMEEFAELSTKDKNKIIFIHFNHTNPIINKNSSETKELLNKGFKIARMDDVFEL